MITIGVDLVPATYWPVGGYEVYACVLANGNSLASVCLQLTSAKHLRDIVGIVTGAYEYYACDYLIMEDVHWRQPIKDEVQHLRSLWVQYRTLKTFMQMQANLQFWKNQTSTHDLSHSKTFHVVRSLAYYPFHEQQQTIKLVSYESPRYDRRRAKDCK